MSRIWKRIKAKLAGRLVPAANVESGEAVEDLGETVDRWLQDRAELHRDPAGYAHRWAASRTPIFERLQVKFDQLEKRHDQIDALLLVATDEQLRAELRAEQQRIVMEGARLAEVTRRLEAEGRLLTDWIEKIQRGEQV